MESANDVSCLGMGTGSAIGAPSEPAPVPPVVVTPEELRRHGIDRVRIIPQVRASCAI